MASVVDGGSFDSILVTSKHAFRRRKSENPQHFGDYKHQSRRGSEELFQRLHDQWVSFRHRAFKAQRTSPNTREASIFTTVFLFFGAGGGAHYVFILTIVTIVEIYIPPDFVRSRHDGEILGSIRIRGKGYPV